METEKEGANDSKKKEVDPKPEPVSARDDHIDHDHDDQVGMNNQPDEVQDQHQDNVQDLTIPRPECDKRFKTAQALIGHKKGHNRLSNKKKERKGIIDDYGVELDEDGLELDDEEEEDDDDDDDEFVSNYLSRSHNHIRGDDSLAKNRGRRLMGVPSSNSAKDSIKSVNKNWGATNKRGSGNSLGSSSSIDIVNEAASTLMSFSDDPQTNLKISVKMGNWAVTDKRSSGKSISKGKEEEEAEEEEEEEEEEENLPPNLEDN